MTTSLRRSALIDLLVAHANWRIGNTQHVIEKRTLKEGFPAIASKV